MRRFAKFNFRLVGALAWSCLAISARAVQVPGFAEITHPSKGDVLSGVVTIEGTASHPAFLGYEMSFAYDPDPSGTWFPIGDRSTTPVSDGRLAVWDTSGITPGTYQLRLMVFQKDGQPLEALIGGLVVGGTAGSSLKRGPTADPSPPTSTPPPAVLGSPGGGSPSPPTTPGANILAVLKIGALSAVAALALISGYALLRPRMRVYLGSLQTRRLYPKRRRDRREGRR